MVAQEKSFLENTILTAWRKSGICPLNSSIFQEEDYTPSINTSSKLHVPQDYPSHIPFDFNIPDYAREDKGSSGICTSCLKAEEPDSDFGDDEELESIGSASSKDDDDDNDDEINQMSDDEEHCGVSLGEAGVGIVGQGNIEEEGNQCGHNREGPDMLQPQQLLEPDHIRLLSESDLTC